MNSTSPSQILYRGTVRHFTSFIEISGIVWLVATLAVAQYFFRICKRNEGLYFPHKFSYRSQAFVACLCFLQLAHALLARISHYMTPGSLTFDDEQPTTWAMQLGFLATAMTTLVCQLYLTNVCYQLCGRKKSFLYLTTPAIFLAFLGGICAILADPAQLKRHTLDFYFSEISSTVVFPFAFTLPVIAIIMKAHYLKPENTINSDLHRIFMFLGIVFEVYLCIVTVSRVTYYLQASPSMFREYSDLATYEVIGNSYPVVVILLMCMPGFGEWEEERALVKGVSTNMVPIGPVSSLSSPA